MKPSFDLASESQKPWPDFYSILDSSPETDADTLRKIINKLYVQANTELDHRELSRRFYFQVLSQKVLPQCRRVLLDKTTRVAYDEQWHLHRDGVSGALSYRDFITGISKNSGGDAPTILSDSELAVLPSFQNNTGSVSAPAQGIERGPAPTGFVAAPVEHAAPVERAAPDTNAGAPIEQQTPVVSIAGSGATALPVATPAPVKKTNPVLLGGLAALLVATVAGALVLRGSGQPEDIAATPPHLAPAAKVVRAPIAKVVKAPAADVSLKTPLTLPFDALVGTAEGDVKIGPGLDGRGLILGGKGALELPQTLDTSQSYTVMAWVKIAPTPSVKSGTTPFQTFLSADGPHQSTFFLQLRADTHRFAFAALPAASAPLATFAGANTDARPNRWTHLTGIYNAPSQTLSLYVDGQLQNTVAFNGAYRGSGVLRVGRAKFANRAADFLTGSLDNAQFFQKALTGAEVLAIAKPLLRKARGR